MNVPTVTPSITEHLHARSCSGHAGVQPNKPPPLILMQHTARPRRLSVTKPPESTSAPGPYHPSVQSNSSGHHPPG